MNGKNEIFLSLRNVLKAKSVHSFDYIEQLLFIFCLCSYDTYRSNERLCNKWNHDRAISRISQS